MQIKANQQAFRVVVIYIIVAAAWILFSDELMNLLVSDPDDRIHLRSEERRVGKECRSRWSPYH